MSIKKTTPPETVAQEQEHLQRMLDYRREEIEAGFDTRGLEESDYADEWENEARSDKQLLADLRTQNAQLREQNNELELYAVEADAIAISLAYLVAGVDHALAGWRVKNGDADHPITAYGGHIGMVRRMLRYAKEIVCYVNANKETRGNRDGVFEYAVTDSLGEWLAEHWAHSTSIRESFTAELKARDENMWRAGAYQAVELNREI